MREKLTSWFRSQVGVTEKNHDNNVIYNTHYYGHEVADPSGNGYAWCLAFIWDGFHTCGASYLFMNGQKSAYCPEFVNWARRVGMWVTSDYRVGDIIFFDWNNDGLADHVGYVICSNPLQTIEGNYSDQVAIVNRTLANVIGAYRPDYHEDTQTIAPVVKDVYAPTSADLIPPEISFGMVGPWVWAMQALLRMHGESLDLDGECGDETCSALEHFQRQNGLTPDRVCGPMTWGKLKAK